MSDWSAPGAKADVPQVGPVDGMYQPSPASPGAAGFAGANPNAAPSRNSGPSGESFGPFDRRGPIPLRPLTFGDILDTSFEVVRQQSRAALLSSLALAFPFYLVLLVLDPDPSVFGGITVLPGLSAFADQTGDPAAFASLVVKLLGPAVVQACMGVVIGRMVQQWYLGYESHASDLLRFLLRRSPALAVAFMVIHLAEFVGLFAAGIGALVVMAFTMLTSPVLAMESVGPIAAIKRSASLVRLQPGRVFVVLVLSVVVGFLIAGALGPLAATNVLPGFFGRFGSALAGLVSLTLLAPIQAAVAVFLYLDVRIRSEGLDLDLSAAGAFDTEAG